MEEAIKDSRRTGIAYRHRDLGLIADLGGAQAVAKPVSIPLTGLLAKTVARGYHLYALPSAAAKVRVAAEWAFASLLPTRVVQLNDVKTSRREHRCAQETDIYYPTSEKASAADNRLNSPSTCGTSS